MKVPKEAIIKVNHHGGYYEHGRQHTHAKKVSADSLKMTVTEAAGNVSYIRLVVLFHR